MEGSEWFLCAVLWLVPHVWRLMDRWLVHQRRRKGSSLAHHVEEDSHEVNGSLKTSPENECENDSSSLEKSIQTFCTDSLTTEEEQEADHDEETTERRKNQESETHLTASSHREPFYDSVPNEFSSSHQDETNASMDLEDLLITEHTANHHSSSSSSSLQSESSPQQRKERSVWSHFLSRSDSHLTMGESNHSNSTLHVMNVSEQLRRKLGVGNQTKKPTCASPRLHQSLSRLNHSSHRLMEPYPSPYASSPKPSILDARRNYIRQQFQQRGINLISPSLQRDRRRLQRRLSNFTEM